ncbi:hypothetical protein FRC02_008682 [Tulasnella sp. 418]|nr:hypothetical protein FRC02_008682 [Tulasnella sp. 418]
MTLAFYCVNGIDILGGIEKLPEDERKGLVEWIWDQQISGPNGESGFRPGPSTSFGTEGSEAYKTTNPYDQPHLIMTYTALIMLAVFRDDMSRLNRKGLTTFLKSLQLDDGSFTPVPGWGESDVRLLYCAFVISKLLDDWSGVDVNKALAFIRKCRVRHHYLFGAIQFLTS